jgi:hypothetical protein
MKHGGEAPAETRLWGLLPGVVLLPAGLLIFGFAIAHHTTTSYIGPCVGMALTCFAVQVITTPICAFIHALSPVFDSDRMADSYLIDAYKSEASEVAQLVNFARQTMAMTVGFWASRFGDKAGYDTAGGVYAAASLIVRAVSVGRSDCINTCFQFFVPVALVMWRGQQWRERQGAPTWNKGV